jgi:hypothetical protein
MILVLSKTESFTELPRRQVLSAHGIVKSVGDGRMLVLKNREQRQVGDTVSISDFKQVFQDEEHDPKKWTGLHNKAVL